MAKKRQCRRRQCADPWLQLCLFTIQKARQEGDLSFFQGSMYQIMLAYIACCIPDFMHIDGAGKPILPEGITL